MTTMRKLYIFAATIAVSALIIALSNSCTTNSQALKPIEVKQIHENVWLLNDNNVSTGFLVLGKKKP